MKNFFLFFTVIMFCTGCQKREIDIFRNQTDNSDSTPVLSTDSANTGVSQQEQKEVRSLQEIIKNYALTELPLGERALFFFQIEGNFTGSGNREIVAFYGRPRNGSIVGALDSAFCFVCNSSGEEIESIYRIKYWTIDFDEKAEADTGYIEAVELGREIIWKGRIIGRAGDFNGNGKEELYLYYLSGMNRSVRFFEFHETEFIDILDLGTRNTFISSVDPDKKIINVQIKYNTGDSTVYITIDNNSYKWDNSTRRYELIAKETKKYIWSWDIEDYVEINDENM